MNDLTFESLETIDKVVENVKNTIQDLEIIIKHWKNIKDRLFDSYKKQEAGLDKSISDGNQLDILARQHIVNVMKKEFDAAHNDYSSALNYKLSLEKTLPNIAAIRNSIETSMVQPTEKIN